MKLNPESDYVHRVAARNIAEGNAQMCEPRLFADTFVFDGETQRVQAAPDVFRNGEKYPLRITHIILAAEYQATDGQSPVAGDERVVQRYGLRIRAHDTYYQNQLSTPLPLWVNKPVSAADMISAAQVTWIFDKPIVIGNRDTMEVQAQLVVDPGANTERVACAFDGVGFYSRQPKRLTGYVDTADLLIHTFDSDDFRNDGTEPMEIHSVTLQHAPATAQSNPIGNIRNVHVRMRVQGNGTGQWWNWTRTTAANQLIGAGLFGLNTGRSIIHRLPGDGWLWFPNEGVTPEIESYITTRSDTIWVAMAGYIMVM